jgi:hypothetical protein
MKKVALSLASVLVAATFAQEASAVPSFARQTGMACSSCHFMKFPVLNGFGRAFKAAGYTMIGSQEKVEGEHLSIPGVLNASLLLKYRYVQDSGNGVKTTAGAGTTAATKAADGQWQMADEFSLFFGGRVAETEHFTIGYMMENNVANPGGALVAGIKLPVNVDLGAAKVSVIPFTTDALGVQYGFELSSGGVMRANRWSELRRETSAIQYNSDRGADGGAAAGTAFVLQNDMGFINFTKWSSSFAPGANGQAVPSTNFGQNYVRVAATPSIAGFDIVAGAGSMSGESYANLVGGKAVSKMTFADAQVHGSVADMEFGLYAQYANAPACAAADGANCVYNPGSAAVDAVNFEFDPVTGTAVAPATTVAAKAASAAAKARTATTIGGEISVIPHALTVGAAYRSATNGKATKNQDNALTLTAVYDLTQNVALHLNYAMYSGSAYDTAGTAKNRLLGMLEAAW